MSKIAKLITATQKYPSEYAYNERPFRMEYAQVEDKLLTMPAPDRSVKYRIRTELGAEVWISEEAISGCSGAIDRAVYNVKRAVIEEIFGEFRQLITKLHIAAQDRDYEKLRVLVEELDHQMFREGL